VVLSCGELDGFLDLRRVIHPVRGYLYDFVNL